MAIWLINPEEDVKLPLYHHGVAGAHSASTGTAARVKDVGDQPAIPCRTALVTPCD